MKGSIKSFATALATVALSLFAMNTQAQLASADEFSSALFVAEQSADTDNYGVTKNGAQIISAYQEDAAIIRLDDKLGLINRQGYEIVAPTYDNVQLFNKGYAAVSKNGKWTFVNKQGKRLTPLRYDWVGSFEQGVAAIMINDKWGLLNEQGFEIVPTVYDAVKLDQDGNIWVQAKGNWKRFNSNNASNTVAAE